MARTPLLRRALGQLFFDKKEAQVGVSRRAFLGGASVAAGALAMPGLLGACTAQASSDDPIQRTRSSLKAINANIGIVGAGIAGLSCAYELRRVGANVTLHEGNERIGGRIWSMGGATWRGQTIERGGELIDTPHKTMIGYAQELGLQLEDVVKPVRDTFYRFGGKAIPEATMVEEYRVLVDAMRDDLRAVGTPTADAFTPADEALDRTSLAEWLAQRGAPTNIRALLSVAYEIEYGVPADRLSCLAFLMFAKASRQSKMRLWGNFSDERYHVVGGNDQIPLGLANKLAGRILMGRRLLAAKKRSDGRIELTFSERGKTITAIHDAVVLAIPFHLLRDVTLDPSLGLDDAKKFAIANAVCGDNAKLMVGFNGRPWVDRGGSGATYSDDAYLQATWETSPTTAAADRAVITDYTGGALARSLGDPQRDAERFLDSFERIVPGAKAYARRDAKGKVVCHLEHWPSSPWTKGAYSANAPGYFTTIEGVAGKPIGNLYFAGEMTDSFYNWQGFMEGGALTGLRAAGEISRDM